MSAKTIGLLQDASIAALGAASAPLLAANTSRNFLLIHNAHATNAITVNLTGGTAVLNTAGNVGIAAGGTLIFDEFVPTNAITAIASGASTPVTVLWM